MENNSRGAGLLAAVIDDRIKKRADSVQEEVQAFDFAEVLADGSLRLNTFPDIIPLEDYTACKNAGNHHYGGAAPPPPQVKPGDRVLVAWVQKQPVLVDVITRAENIVKGK